MHMGPGHVHGPWLCKWNLVMYMQPGYVLKPGSEDGTW